MILSSLVVALTLSLAGAFAISTPALAAGSGYSQPSSSPSGVSSSSTSAGTKTVVAGGTSPVTGKPFLLEGLVASFLVVSGVVLLVRVRLRRSPL